MAIATGVLMLSYKELPDLTTSEKKNGSISSMKIATNCTPVWPTDDNLENKEGNEELIGKGRNKCCSCESPGSVECIKSHVKEERMKMKSELETTFDVWKFDEMGEEVSNLWNAKEQRKFSSPLRRIGF
ncbi:hypothetical protein HAX54_025221 [Datura stramonium]|uniref:Uncharacterized protein n=1 Tax=Datura stramonium TaxID=4076 RepID=A0ABS8S615_DATST|nr:hypothetical protein [Datura stramonium]